MGPSFSQDKGIVAPSVTFFANPRRDPEFAPGR
jgi:hypothetical protein